LAKSAADIATRRAVCSPYAPALAGVPVRAGHTEAAVDISRLAGLNPSGVICEIMNVDGTMARLPDLVAFAQLRGAEDRHNSDLIAYRRRHDNLVRVRTGTNSSCRVWWRMADEIYADETHGDEHGSNKRRHFWRCARIELRIHAMDAMLDVVGIGPAGAQTKFSEAMARIAERRPRRSSCCCAIRQ
jgi:3,4-dihydroxy 2-butanone 4-phosphate synthase/GTP cyclohydrolase II